MRAVVIHGPDFLGAGAIRNEIDLGAGQALGAELLQNVGGEFARHFLRTVGVERAEIQFADDLGAGRVRLRRY